ncbi:MAG TPA: hypothetical protein VFE53_16000 [Mucilaginibacter sp.]|jgi:hypothetical protein|nr:hypothetical protein [Mucilaginibacter sp.]
MRYFFLTLVAILFAAAAHAQDTSFHYIKLIHVGERIMSVRTLNISTGDGRIRQDSVEALNDTLKAVFYSTDAKSYKFLSDYVDDARFKIRPLSSKVEFGTFKIIADGKRYYVPDLSVTLYFKKMVVYLKKKKADPQLIQAIIDNYPWVFNP